MTGERTYREAQLNGFEEISDCPPVRKLKIPNFSHRAALSALREETRTAHIEPRTYQRATTTWKTRL